MLPNISDLGIQLVPAYIHKIDRRTFWESTDDIEKRADNAVARVFKDPECLYSFWRVESDFDFSCVAASLNANRGSPSEEINFIWTTDTELNAFNLIPEQVEEGKCLYARKLHYNISINSSQAYKFCFNLMELQRKACRCKKNQMPLVIQHLTEQRCEVYDAQTGMCSCSLSLVSRA